MTTSEQDREEAEKHRVEDERIDEASEESFPASDPPASWAGKDSKGSKVSKDS